MGRELSMSIMADLEINRSFTTMEKLSDFEQALADKIHYRCVDVDCCLTCAHGEYFDFDKCVVMCHINTYYNPELGSRAYWFGEQLGICDNYEKKRNKGVAAISN
jgi:hypothetical protein